MSQVLLANGAQPDIRNNEGMTAAALAQKKGYRAVADLIQSKTGGTTRIGTGVSGSPSSPAR